MKDPTIDLVKKLDTPECDILNGDPRALLIQLGRQHVTLQVVSGYVFRGKIELLGLTAFVLKSASGLMFHHNVVIQYEHVMWVAIPIEENKCEVEGCSEPSVTAPDAAFGLCAKHKAEDAKP